MSEGTARCVICTGERSADVGLLCRGHYTRMGQMLADLENEAAILSAVPSMQQRIDGGKGSLASERAPARLDVVAMNDRRTRQAGKRPPGPACAECWHGSCIDIRAWVDAYDARATDVLSILDVLGSWAQVVREERGLTAFGAATVVTEVGTLRFHLDWVVEQGWIDEAYTDLRTLVGQLKAANGTVEEKPAGRCPDLVTGSDCGGPVWIDSAAGHAYCARCSRTWDGAELHRLSIILEEQRRPHTDDGRPMRTADEIMRDENLTRSAFDVKAHRLRKAGQGGISHGGYYDPAGFEQRSMAG